jgi:hypothetical protein
MIKKLGKTSSNEDNPSVSEKLSINVSEESVWIDDFMEKRYGEAKQKLKKNN